jgi:hypothetical protein
VSISNYFPTVTWLIRRWKRILAFGALAVVGLAISAVAALHLDEYIVLARAERLERGFEKVVVGKTTIAEARGILRVSGSGSETVEQRVGETGAALSVYLNGPLVRRLVKLLGTHPETERKFTQACLLMGVHPSLISVRAISRGGVVTEKEFTVTVASPSESESAKWLSGWVSVAPELPLRGIQLDFPKRELQIHPEYVVGHNKGVSSGPGYPIEAEYIRLKFTPAANPADFQRLTRFNLDCLARWRPCRTAADLMPEAWKQFKQDLGSSKETPPGFHYQ